MNAHRLAMTFAFAAVLGIAGCAGPALTSPEIRGPGRIDPEISECERFFEALDAAVEDAGVRDAQTVPVVGFPHLRANRLLASFADAVASQEAFAMWHTRLRALDREARQYEIVNLPAAMRASLAGDRDAANQVQRCGARLARRDRADPRARAALTAQVRVPPSYDTALRVLGLYPLSSALVSVGIANLQDAIRTDFAIPLDDLPVHGTLIRYGPPASHDDSLDPARALAGRAANPLAIPRPRAADLERLFDAFAPVWEIDVYSENDRIGTPGWAARDAPAPHVDVSRPVLYRHVSHARFADRVLLQLNYVVWFPARPRRGPLDLLGGRLDGITWRVTLDPHGRPLIYDAMHNCGCYHMAFPTSRLRVVKSAPQYEEPLLMPQMLDVRPGRTVIRVARNSHYIQRVYFEETPHIDVTYAMGDYASLRALPLPGGGRRSLFGPDALVSGTQRRERWLLWPMGVPSPGAMRQWGNHAVAFVGRRHFDDPFLFETFFEPREDR